jgi:hypothetical protein
MANFVMPHNWDCFNHQRPLWNFLESGGKRAVAVWHRRAGKDSTVLNYTATDAIDIKGTYYHMLPTLRQAKRVVWDAIDRGGRRMIDQAFPKKIRRGINKQEMQIELLNGSMWQLCGSDNYDSLVGTNPKGIIFSEWALCNPKAWDYIRPILMENEGWAVFIYTPRGKNHGWTLSQMAKNDPDWFHSILNVEQTFRNDGTRIITPEAIEAERRAGMSEEKIQQECYCDFDIAIEGAYFAKELATARADGRIGFVPIEQELDVHTFWDLGMSKGNAMCLWFVQALGKEIRVINYYEAENEGMPHFKQYLDDFQKKHNIHYGLHHAPFDINVRELSSGKKRIDVLRGMGLRFVLVEKTKDLNDSIEMTRRLIPRCWFDEKRCGNGLSGLHSYHREIDESRVGPAGETVYKDKPEHDWASNPADAFRQMAQSWHERLALSKREAFTETVQADLNFQIFT